MIRIIGIGAHVGRADIEKVIGMDGRVGGSTSDDPTPLDQGGAGPVVAYEIDGKQRAGKTTTDDDDMGQARLPIGGPISGSQD